MSSFRNFRRTQIILFITLFVVPNINAQTKKLKRPKSSVGISSVDNFVRESFDLYDKVYIYDNYVEAGTPLSDDDIDILQDALNEITVIYESAPHIISDIQGHNALRQAKATLQVNRAKKALKYSIKTAKVLLSGERKKKKEESEEDTSSTEDGTSDSSSTENTNSETKTIEEAPSNVSDNLKVYSKFDFIPGDKLIFFDDFANDFVGDFPSKWNTNGSGEIVTFNDSPEKWFEIKAGYNTFYIPLLPRNLPEEYTIEFDLLTSGLDRQTSSSSNLEIVLEDNDEFKRGYDYVRVLIPLCQYYAINLKLTNSIANKNSINSSVKTEIRNVVLNKPHISIAVNKQRYRLWINEKKYVDVPRMIGLNAPMKTLKLKLNNIKEDKEHVLIKNLKIAEGGVDLRRKLMAEGKISTNGILFDSGSANIQPQSYGIIRQISQVLIQNNSINLNIVGHTDADGVDNANMKLSKQRADAVKHALINIYSISGNRLQTQGKGESEPVSDNSSSDGKAQNRRVEFIKV